MRNDYYVKIVHRDTGHVEKEMGPMPRRKAEKVCRGAEINLNHADYRVDITTGDDHEPRTTGTP